MQKPIAIYYEHPDWLKPLFAEMDRRGTHYVKVLAAEHTYGVEDSPEHRYALVVNRMSLSAWDRNHGDCIFYTLGFLEQLEARGVRVINGWKAFRTELSKAAQLTLLEGLGLGYPRARVIHRAEQALAATRGLRWPVAVKPNIGGSGAGGRRLDAPEQLKAAAEAGELAFGLDSTALVQEFIPARGKHIVRVEVLNGKYLYAIKVHTTGETLDLCTAAGMDLHRAAGAVDAPETGIRVEGYEPPAEVIAEVERIMAQAGIELGGVEYLTDDRDGQRLYYDIHVLSNFVADGPQVVGLDPFVKLVDWLEDEAARQSECRGRGSLAGAAKQQ